MAGRLLGPRSPRLCLRCVALPLDAHRLRLHPRILGLHGRPPRTLVQQQTIINNTTIVQNNNVVNNNIVNNNTVVNKTTVLAPAKTVMAARGIPSAPLDTATRTQVKQASQAVQVAAATQRAK